MQQLRDELTATGIKSDISGRAKHIYSIWRKMQRKGLEFSQIYDVRAVRVLVPEVRDCYTALGIVHTCGGTFPASSTTISPIRRRTATVPCTLR